MRLRHLLLGLGALVSIGRVLPAQALTPFQRQKAERMLREQLGCLGCHQLGGQGGKLAPPLDNVRARRDPGYIAAIITNPGRVRPGAVMPRLVMPDRDRALIIRYLGGDPTAVTVPPSPLPVAVPSDTSASRLYASWCAGCHGAKGKGDGPNATSLPVPPARHADAATTSLRSDDSLFDTIAGGGAIMNRSARMPAFGGSLSPTEIRGLVRYIRTLCQCQGPLWSRGGAG
ncbi:c-type cytochrome [Gemmatimonas sp.]|uniref:c-type cytochrome n=1 Tax=Gemmatimonas sp. TaxID=1962908 RepID=UPI0039835682